jgi:hypothetical protein
MGAQKMADGRFQSEGFASKKGKPSRTRKYRLFFFALAALEMAFSLARTGFSEDPAEFSKGSLQSEEAKTNIENIAKRKCILMMTQDQLLISYKQFLYNLKWTQSQKELPVILNRVGENVAAFFQRVISITASEHLILERSINWKIKGRQVHSVKKYFNYNYIMLPPSGENERLINEYRTDSKNRPVDRNAELNSFMVSTGYFGLCLYLHPRHQPNSIFRYLGRERGKEGNYIIAFAQKPWCRDYIAQVDGRTTTSFLVQGFIWIDPKTFQITRLRTSLLLPDAYNDTSLEEQITDAEYDKVVLKIGKDQKKQLWLPREVDIYWEFPYSSYHNRHIYSNYHLFFVSAKIDYPAGIRPER